MADAAATAPISLLSPGGPDLALSSTVLNSSAQRNAQEGTSPSSQSLTRLRRRLSGQTAQVERPQDDVHQSRRRTEGLNAFDILGSKLQPASVKQHPRFVDEQAEESDDDDGWFLPRKDDDDEEDDDPADDGYVKELVDDSTLSAEDRRQLALQAAEKHR